MITGRCGTWCTIHLRNGPACVVSLSYGSIKHFIIKHYSKQTFSLKGKGEKYNMNGYMLYPIIFPYSTPIIAIYSLLFIMEPLPRYKNRSKGTTVCSSCDLSSFLIDGSRTWYILPIFSSRSNSFYKTLGWWWQMVEGADGVLFWNLLGFVGFRETKGYGRWVCGGNGSITSWQSELRGPHPPPPLAAADATGRWGDGGWPACRTSVSAQPP